MQYFFSEPCLVKQFFTLSFLICVICCSIYCLFFLVLAECDGTNIDLVGGNSSLEGYVQFCSEGRLGLLCSDQWNDEEAMVVCRQLGLPFTGKTSTRKINHCNLIAGL